jgi:hypothetical protein
MDPHRDASIAVHTPPTGPPRHKTSSVRNEKNGKLFSIRIRLASSLDASSGSGGGAECFVYKNTLIGRRFKSIQFCTVSRIGKKYNATAGQVAPTWVLAREWTSSLSLVPPDFRYVRYRDRISLRSLLRQQKNHRTSRRIWALG